MAQSDLSPALADAAPAAIAVAALDPELSFWLVGALLAALPAFHDYTAAVGLLRKATRRSVHLAFVLAPARRGQSTSPAV